MKCDKYTQNQTFTEKYIYVIYKKKIHSFLKSLIFEVCVWNENQHINKMLDFFKNKFLF